MQHLLTINGRLDNMNDYTRACRTNQYKGAKMKQKNDAVVIRAILEQLGRLRITKPVIIRYRWYEPNKRRDLDNISSFGRKVIQDALVECGVLANDGWKEVCGFTDSFSVTKKEPCVTVELEEVEE